MTEQPQPGATYVGGDTCRFAVWAPFAAQVDLRLHAPVHRSVRLDATERGYHTATVTEVPPGTRYTYVLDGVNERPDPASRYQPVGVHGPSQVCDPCFPWTRDNWRGIPLRDYIVYELHVGTFTTVGTFDAVIGHLAGLASLGVTAIELMPVAQFPGGRNWGYDGAYPYAAQNTYGGPSGLKKLVDACHAHGLAVVLDVVYNHFGPEGAYAADFAPYFTDRYHTPWGRAINFDGAGSDEVRAFFIGNALYWLDEFRIDALRLDALHAILDTSPMPFLQELSDAVHEMGRRSGRHVYLIGENDLNDPRLVRRRNSGGIGIDAQWNDDFHHALHVALTGEGRGYYADFAGATDLAASFKKVYVYAGAYSSYRGHRHGAPADDIPSERFVVCAQNHDQVGNRKVGDRLSTLVSFESLKAAAACVLLSPFLPLLFMGEEYGEITPFPYFVSHSDPDLIEAVRKGRAAEFAAFEWGGGLPDPQSEATFQSAVLNRGSSQSVAGSALMRLYSELIAIRKQYSPLSSESREDLDVENVPGCDMLMVRKRDRGNAALLALNFGERQARTAINLPAGRWCVRLDTSAGCWAGPGSAVPAHVDSTGVVELDLSPCSALLLMTDKGEKD
jgi:maltooligosyltrehalose trehalohydrolase